MNFFAAQHHARRSTVKIILLLIVAVLAIDIALYGLAHGFKYGAVPSLATLDYFLLLDLSMGFLALVSIGSLYKVLVLRSGGGAAVAQSMGGRLINPGTRVAQEKQLLNIVEEMAIAANTPRPQVYVIPDRSINAFAAGMEPGTAVIGVTQGALDDFSRDEMQGVIAHEFSHIINGDMRLNMRLTGVIHGIMLLSYLGYFLLRAGLFSSFPGSGGHRRNGTALALPLIGVALTVIGAIGAFFGKWIRAAVSRQREYLADASAVQFTRNPRGIGGALQKIGIKTGLLKNPHASEYAHMFFSEGIASGFLRMMATHPPLAERISRILPGWDGQLHAHDRGREEPLPATPQETRGELTPAAMGLVDEADVPALHSKPVPDPQPKSPELPERGPPDLFALLFNRSVRSDRVSLQVGTINEASLVASRTVLNELPEVIEQAFGDSCSARALVYAALLHREPDSACQRAQLEYLRRFADTDVYPAVIELAPEVLKLPLPVCLILLLRAVPALRLMSARQYQRFVFIMTKLIETDAKATLFEWAAEAVLLHYLDPFFGRHGDSPLPAAGLAMEYALSLLASAGADDPRQASDAFITASKKLGENLRFHEGEMEPQKLYAAMCRLNRLPPSAKQAFLDAAGICATRDGVINPDENVLLHAYAALIDCPLPIDIS